MSLQPVGKSILVKKKEVESKVGTLLMPEQKGKPGIVSVVAVGEKVELGLLPDETLMLYPHAGLDVEIEGVKYLMISEKDVMGKIRPCNNT